MDTLEVKYFVLDVQNANDGVNKKLLSQASGNESVGAECRVGIGRYGMRLRPSHNDFLTVLSE